MMKLRNLTEREKLGYRDGVEEGKNSSVQEGFDEGYREAAIAGFNWGVARGITRFVLKPSPPPFSSTSFKMYIVPCLTLMSSLLLQSLLLLLHFPSSIMIFSLASECLGFRGLGFMVD